MSLVVTFFCTCFIYDTAPRIFSEHDCIITSKRNSVSVQSVPLPRIFVLLWSWQVVYLSLLLRNSNYDLHIYFQPGKRSINSSSNDNFHLSGRRSVGLSAKNIFWNLNLESQSSSLNRDNLVFHEINPERDTLETILEQVKQRLYMHQRDVALIRLEIMLRAAQTTTQSRSHPSIHLSSDRLSVNPSIKLPIHATRGHPSINQSVN